MSTSTVNAQNNKASLFAAVLGPVLATLTYMANLGLLALVWPPWEEKASAAIARLNDFEMKCLDLSDWVMSNLPLAIFVFVGAAITHAIILRVADRPIRLGAWVLLAIFVGLAIAQAYYLAMPMDAPPLLHLHR